MELLNGHPQSHLLRAWGFSHHVFTELIYELRGLGLWKFENTFRLKSNWQYFYYMSVYGV